MCGIIGNFGFIENDYFESHLKQIDDSFKRRGPDQHNNISLQNFFGAHSRLIIQGNENDGMQPFCFNDTFLLFNGNLYNKEILRAELQSFGYKFAGISDTEVVAYSIFHWGSEAFKKFNGFFAIAYYDNSKKKLILARDRLGQKPLYYAQNSRSVFFGSTENFIPTQFRGKLRQESFIDFLTFGFIPAPNTMFKDVFSLKPGSLIEFTFSNHKVSANSSCDFWIPSITNDITDINAAVEIIEESISHSLHEGMDASIDVACLFSGGVDSSLIFTNARKINHDIAGITANFGEGDDAKKRSSSLAQSLGHEHHLIKEISGGDVQASLKKVYQICHAPFDDTSVIPSNLVFQTVRESGYSVALTGDGADELFCGYSSFKNLNKIEKFLDQRFDRIIRAPGRFFEYPISKFKNLNLTRFFLPENDLLVDLLCNGFKKREWIDSIDTDYDPLHYLHKILVELDGLRPLDKLRILNLKFKLPYQMLFKVDRTSMFNSVEARPLFLNNRIVDAALTISSSAMMQEGSKTILKKIYKSQLNHSGWSLPKTGFGWKTNSYEQIFSEEDNNYLIEQTGINGLSLLQKRNDHHKRGYFGLHSLVSWLKNYYQ
tara:strand:+ start:36780 stop:38585 length:1806 start_codon:yes stop_codon:yes gene_type:complete